MSSFKFTLLAGLLAAAASMQVSASTVYGLTTDNNLISFDSATPGIVNSTVAITGTTGNANLTGIDFRPSNGMLYGLDVNSRFYTINTATGAATFAGLLTGFDSGVVGFDFNPAADRLRVVNPADQNLRVNVATGATIVDGTISYAPGDAAFGINPQIAGSAYTNSFGGTVRSTSLFNIDSGTNTLVLQSPPNDGTLQTVGSLGFDVTDQLGFDIRAVGNLALASLTLAGSTGASGLYLVNLGTGTASLVGQFGGLTVLDIAAVQIPEPETFLLLGVGMLAFAATRTRRRTV